MTRIDRYILVLFLRTVLICFLSLAGIFIVFHAFSHLDEMFEQAERAGGGWAILQVMGGFYGPYMLLLFDMTGTVITLMALLFTVGWLRRLGELTSMLAAGVSHGRILQPMVMAAGVIILAQLANREFVLPHLRDHLDMEEKTIGEESEQIVQAKEDRTIGVVMQGRGLLARSKIIVQPSFRLYGDYPGFGGLLQADQAHWRPKQGNIPSGYLMTNVTVPEDVGQIPSLGTADRPILLTSADQSWLEPNQCFVATTIDTDMLATSRSAKKLASIVELCNRIRNPAVHTSLSLQTLLHERVVRVPLDFALILLGLPMVVNRRGRNLFTVVGIAIGTVIFFFALKTLGSTMGSSGVWLPPAMGAWLPLLVIGPVAYVRYRDVQLV